MRRAEYNTEWLMDDTQFIGVNLGAAFVSEHEWGYGVLQKLLGINDDKSVFGIERRRVNNLREGAVKLVEESDTSGIEISVSLNPITELSVVLNSLMVANLSSRFSILSTLWSNYSCSLR